VTRPLTLRDISMIALIGMATLSVLGCGSAEHKQVATIHSAKSSSGSALVTSGLFYSLAHVELREGSQRYGCSGTVIANRAVLTAAHCVLNARRRPVPASDLTVIVGTFDLSEPRQETSGVSRVFVFPPFLGPAEVGDAAILLLDIPTSVELSVPPSPHSAPPEEGTLAATAGFGRQGATAYVDGVAHEIPMHIRSKQWCNSNASPMGPTYEMCATVATPAVHPCRGDSGAPLVVAGPKGQPPTTLGILSSARTCTSQYPLVFTSLAAIEPWIETILKRNT
jgi:trypsin